MGGQRDGPRDVDFVVIGRIRTDGQTSSRQCLMPMHVHRRRRGLVLEFFRVNMVKRRLDEPPQEGDYAENDAAGSHDFFLSYHG